MFTNLLHTFRALELTREAADYRLAEAARLAAADTGQRPGGTGTVGEDGRRLRVSYRTAA
ncbi:hypothetical protein ACIHFE_07360 [Streptomyces sp. NPDC052396]|uniref:hypothetical protein n=1 Tax=Streptomyces sp. NPDC052396 TaxID=3365689 RepID=UPI0037D1F66D